MGGLAQLARAPAWQAGGRGFKSRILHWGAVNIDLLLNMKPKKIYAERMNKVKSILEALELAEKNGGSSLPEKVVSINDLRDREDSGKLTREEKTALDNYNTYRVKKLNIANDEEDFHSMYRLLQVLANLSPYQEFLHEKYKV